MTATKARDIMEKELRRELFGPLSHEASSGTPLDCAAGTITFENKDESKGPFREKNSGQEILTLGTPLTRYGVGVLHGGGKSQSYEVGTSPEPITLPGLAEHDEDLDEPIAKPSDASSHDDPAGDDFDLSSANSFRPSAMGVSFQCAVDSDSALKIVVTGAKYRSLKVRRQGETYEQKWWVREPFTLTGMISGKALLTQIRELTTIPMTFKDGDHERHLETQFYSRQAPHSSNSSERLVTLTLTNTHRRSGPEQAYFQMGFQIEAEDSIQFLPYPETHDAPRTEEEQSIDLLYRNKRTYAIGHGCAAAWDDSTATPIRTINSTALPSYDVMSLTPNIYRTDASGNHIVDTDGKLQPLAISMSDLADDSENGRAQVDELISLYSAWINERNSEIHSLPSKLQAAAHRHIDRARDALNRIKTGWELVKTDPQVNQVFKWANEAMLHQQIRSTFPLRRVSVDKKTGYTVQDPHPDLTVQPGRGNWRPFQIAFILATLPELIDPTRDQRSLVDLIFFPTGGGKTEAYLGACAVSLLARRLRNRDDAGTDTIMRYTLRLLTAQQFLRASSLICVLEDLRSKNTEALGRKRFSIGIWVGGDTTPNTRKQAVKSLKDLQKYASEPNKFLLLRCPWCGAQMGTKKMKSGGQHPVGYELLGKSVIFRCVDRQCRYSKREGLPIYVIDEDIYDQRPSILIGTVDKFAMLPWRPAARAIFGLNDHGERETSPPGLIIQDELHLISGPLGSMVGLYEPIIEELCTDYRFDTEIPPKIIAATATTRSYEAQVRGVFGRDNVALFPPHGLEDGHSFFAEPSINSDGSSKPGRRYLGVMSASFGSTQTVQTRVAAATLQGANKIPTEHRDGYWTNLNFFNSLRELGNTVSLLESDVPDYLKGLEKRDGITPRWPRNRMELTSRRRSDEVPQAIEELEVNYDHKARYQRAVDICLASNIIEVGIDIDRLGLLTIVGQPKTTAQYIQVSGRVGRNSERSPGLVVTIYGASKPRDRSHYERFQTYHQQLYAQVEPTSVTPFAAPVLKRALHAAAIAYIRMTSPLSLKPSPFPRDAYARAMELLERRARVAGDTESLAQIAEYRAHEWAHRERTEWDANPQTGSPLQGLMRSAGSVAPRGTKTLSWDVPTSMRNVDAECRLEIAVPTINSPSAPEG